MGDFCNHQELKIDLAAAFRLAAVFGWTESVGNHFSVSAVKQAREGFFMNPRWKHFGEIKASDLIWLDLADEMDADSDGAPDPSGWAIHSSLHKQRSDAQVILHCHPPYATVLSTLDNPEMIPIDQNTARFFEHIDIDHGFSGIAHKTGEASRIAANLNRKIMLMGNHGVTVIGSSVATAFEDLYFFERAAKILVTAYSTGKKLSVLSEKVARETADEWRVYAPQADAHFEYLKRQLERSDSTYRE